MKLYFSRISKRLVYRWRRQCTTASTKELIKHNGSLYPDFPTSFPNTQTLPPISPGTENSVKEILTRNLDSSRKTRLGWSPNRLKLEDVVKSLSFPRQTAHFLARHFIQYTWCLKGKSKPFTWRLAAKGMGEDGKSDDQTSHNLKERIFGVIRS